MPEIKILDQSTINKIAAGEVVERPSSVVKELVENSIDANASAVTVEIKEGGISFIRITDNGKGISKEDIQTAFIRHSTSKIKSIEDLVTVSSLGFRGEALASIAAVSQVEVITKTYDDITGVRYVIEGGKEISKEEIGCPEGTTIIVNNIFFNTPARRKFLKKPATEGAYVSELINKLALGNMHISFKFIYNNTIKLHTSGNNVLKDCIFNIYGKEIAKNIVPIEIKEDDFEIKGYIGKPSISRANRNYENYYINGRYIKSKIIMKAIEEGYKTKLTVHRYPFTAFYIKINPELIDVNVHPTKMEVRFHNESIMYSSFIKGINESLRKIDLIPEVTIDNKKKIQSEIINSKKASIPEPFEKNRLNQIKNDILKEKATNYKDTDKNNTFIRNSQITNDKVHQTFLQTIKPDNKEEEKVKKETAINAISDNTVKKEISNLINNQDNNKVNVNNNQKQIVEQGVLLESEEPTKKTIKSHKIIGQLFNTYWIVELENKFYIIDQHAAHERVLYERFMNKLKNMEIMSQGLLQPIIIHVSIREKQLVKDYKKLFDELGFEIEEFGKDAYAIRSVPYIFNKSLSEEQFIDILDNLNEHYDPNKYDMIRDNIATMACKAAVKAHDKLSLIEYEKLFDELLKIENPYTCPHGRPTIISMTKYELEKKFKRIQ
ncbi:DNA mismatch repair protein MutL [Vallitalea longa]|uniref:DNA mismatch repair protein MutL n=1 Tax=Vallitalea longa TaxID=2936439 RepID=A0A9W5YF99_9FIRM|nr:DNA mismatch repair endonuclease MutL [Vallitalea longa]GKX30133.1 DNA mismatch repair protein MutL [Vallitalea longa]